MTFTILVGDMREQLADLPRRSVDAIVCDPPYEIEFLGRGWDSSGVAFDPETWRACFRVLKPGGHLLAFGATRTFHRIAVAIEDAGFEIRDTIAWCYKQGFPKSLDVSKAIDGMRGEPREVIGSRRKLQSYGANQIFGDGPDKGGVQIITAPATDDARRWQGWGTALKPAMEPCILARKPLTGTVVENVLAYGTGALNIDGSRIGETGGTRGTGFQKDALAMFHGESGFLPASGVEDAGGRWPANLVMDEAAAEHIHGEIGGERCFFVAKPSTTERENGLDFLPKRLAHELVYKPEGTNLGHPGVGAGRTSEGRANFHPTVKPIALMRHLVRLVTPPGGVVCDPFTGSGTTGIAALQEGFSFVGCELDTAHATIAWHRIAVAERSIEGAKRRAALLDDDEPALTKTAHQATAADPAPEDA